AATALIGFMACGPEKDPGSPSSDVIDEPGSAGVATQETEEDSASARWQANWAWYNDNAPYVPSQKGHSFSRTYMQFLNRAAAQERLRHSNKIPINTRTFASGKIITTSPSDSLSLTGSSWVNLGPTTAAIEKNGSTIPGVDSGRVTAIVPHPTNASILYVAFAAGGVW